MIRAEPIEAVFVSHIESGEEFYRIGVADVTAIVWGEVSGHMSMIDTVIVFKNGKLHSEHTFTQCLGVYFA